MTTFADLIAALKAVQTQNFVETQNFASLQAANAAHIPSGLLSERVAALTRENVALQDACADLRVLIDHWQARAIRAEAQLAAARVELSDRRPWLNER